MKKHLPVAVFLFLDIHLTVFSQGFSSSNLPIVIIDTHGQYIDTAARVFNISMGIIYNGPGKRNNVTDIYNNYNGNAEIELHGSSTLLFPKKSYGITLVDAFNRHVSMSLLGMPPDDDWVLKAHYQDKSLIRDNLTFEVFKRMGRYSARTKFLELVVDGDYRGVYELQEKIRRSPYRVNISGLKKYDIYGDNLTGGYIIKLDKFLPGEAGWFSKYKSNLTRDSANYFLYHYPHPDSIVDAQKNYIKNFFDKFEDVLASPYFKDPDSGYSKYLNLPSFIDNFLINEFSRNVDGYRSSSYFYKERDSGSDGKLHCGPVWDYNLAWKNCSYNGGNNPAGWQYQQFASQNFVPFWWWQIMSDHSFKNQLKCRYLDLRQGVFSETALNQYIDSLAFLLDEAQARNFTRWPILGQVVYPNPSPVPATYTEEVASVKSWIRERLAWMDVSIPGVCNTGTDEKEFSENTIRLFPNPFSSGFSIAYHIPGYSGYAWVKIELLTARGDRVLVLFEGKQSMGAYQNEFSCERLSPGMYILKLNINNDVFYKKIAKDR